MAGGYEPLGSLTSWSSVAFDQGRWERVAGLVADLEVPDDLTWLEGPLRAAAYQSGAIEGLHRGDRGLTLTLIEAAPGWEAELREEQSDGTDVAAFVAAGVEALHMALDVATASRPITEAWIRQVHEVVCGPQETYLATTSIGPQRLRLPKGTYKEHDNNVVLPNGDLLAFAPAIDVPAEMARLVEQLRSDEFARAPAAVQAAAAHHGLTHIHPFVDGNGRVARVLASVYLMRAVSLPFFLFVDAKPRYLDALQSADNGNPSLFVQLVLSCTEDLAGLLVQRQRAAAATNVDAEALNHWRDAVDAAERFADAVSDARDRALVRAQLRGHRVVPGLRTTVERLSRSVAGDRLVPGDLPAFRQRHIEIKLALTDADVLEEDVSIILVRTQLSTKPLRATAQGANISLECRLDEVWPVPTTAFELRLDAWMDEVLGQLVDRLNEALRVERSEPRSDDRAV